jgi:phosphate acetyltransferase
MIDTFNTILSQAASNPRPVALAEGADSRVVEAAVRAARDKIAVPVLIGPRADVQAQLRAFDADSALIEIVDPVDSPHTARFASEYHELRKHKGVDQVAAEAAVLQPLNFAAMLVRSGEAEGCIGGAIETTAATVRAALQVIGVSAGVSTVSSFFLMFPADDTHAHRDTLMFSDCALVISPSAEQLADIACSSSDSYLKLTGETPRTALLSFSTAGSGSHVTVTTVSEATALAQQARPDLLIDGELQFDAAIVESVAARKAPLSPLKGAANVFIFPNLDAGNIGYKIAQRLGGMKAVGPILQGLKQPANDLSRGCDADDVYALLAVTCVQAQPVSH